MVNVDGSGLLTVLSQIWETLSLIRVDFGLFSFSLMEYEIAVLFVTLVLDFMAPFWFGMIEDRALKQHKAGAFEWD